MRVRAAWLGSIFVGTLLAGGVAHATPIFDVTVWSAATPGSTISSSSQQALPTNTTLIQSGNEVATFTMTGLPNWDIANGGTNNVNNTLGNFIGGATGPGISNFAAQGSYTTATALADILSTSSFASASIFDLSFTVNHQISATVWHDDGMSIWSGDNSTLIPGTDSASPTTAIGTNVTLGPGSYNLWYVEANGAPSVLKITNYSVPEPGMLPLFAMGLLGVGSILAYRRRAGRV